MQNSKLWLLNHKDLIKSGVMFVLSAILTAIYSAISNKIGIDWSFVGHTAVLATITYLLKQLGTDQNGKLGGKL